MPSQKDVTEIIGHIRATKRFKVAKNGSKHWKVLTLKGAVVTDADGPLIISGSPSDERFKEMTIKRLMAANVLTQDPYKATTGRKGERNEAATQNGNGARTSRGGGNNDLGARQARDPEFKARLHAAKVEAIHKKAKLAREATAVLRGRFEPIVPHLGGWSGHGGSHGLKATELAEVAFYWGSSRGRVELPKTTTQGQPMRVEQVRPVMQTLKTPGQTLGDKWRPFIEVFVDELWQHAGRDPKKAAARYMELLRESKGLVSEPKSPPAGQAKEPSAGDPLSPPDPAGEEPQYERVGPLHQVSVPSLALRSLFWFAKGGMEEQDALKAAEEIAKLELRGGN